MGCPDFWDTIFFILPSETQDITVMIANNFFSIDALIDVAMTHLFKLAEYVCNHCSLNKGKSATIQSKSEVPTIRFSIEDRMVEGELFESV